MIGTLFTIIAGTLVAMMLFTSGVFSNNNYDTAAVTNTPAPESTIYGGGANSATASAMTSSANLSMESHRLASVEQSLVEICRATYWMGKSSGCSPLNEAFTWSFMFQNGNTGSLNTVQGLSSSSSFSCSTPGQYGVYLLNNIYSATDLSAYTYNLNNSAGTGPISGQHDPCAYANIVN